MYDYTLKYLLGEGGMAEVWYAENRIGKPAAIKILKEEFMKMKQVVDRFENEEYLKGQNLSNRMKQRAF